MIDYAASVEVCRQILKDNPDDKRAQWKAVQEIECKHRREHVTELLRLHYKAMSNGFRTL